MGVISEWDKAADMELLGVAQANAKDYTDTQVSSLSGVMDEINAKIEEVKAITEQAKNAATNVASNIKGFSENYLEDGYIKTPEITFNTGNLPATDWKEYRTICDLTNLYLVPSGTAAPSDVKLSIHIAVDFPSSTAGKVFMVLVTLGKTSFYEVLYISRSIGYCDLDLNLPVYTPIDRIKVEIRADSTGGGISGATGIASVSNAIPFIMG